MKTRRQFLSYALAGAVAACAPAPPPSPAIPIASIDSIAGTWRGTVFYRDSASPGTMTIDRDGTWISTAFDRRFHGTFTLINGKATWKSLTTGATGSWTLRKANGVITLFGRGSNGATSESTRAH